MPRVLRGGGFLLFAALLLGVAPAAHAAPPGPGVQRIDYMVGPIDVTPGQNRIAYRPVAGEKPPVDGWITRIKPNLVRADGSVPPTNQVMFHHGVWLNLSAHDTTIPSLPQRFYATGEEKTTMAFPKGFGLRYHAGDVWLLNHMIHNLTPRPMTLYVSYTLDFIPDSSPAAAGMRPLRPVWLDVQNGSFYPVFDVHRGSGKNGRFTYPTQADNPYPDGVAKNLWQVDRDGVLVAGAGHLHSGGLYSDLYLRRSGAHYRGPRCGTRATARLRARCRRQAPSVRGNRAHLFRSTAKYWEPFGPVSWDMAMKVTPPTWRVAVKKGDILENTATYETKRASWYESMGIEILYMADGSGGKDPYRTKVDLPGRVTHGHLAENSNHGGRPTDLADPRLLPAAGLSPDPLAITQFSYAAGDLNDDAPYNRPATVKHGQSLTFQLSQRDASQEIWHSITSCAAPCNRSTGIAYPIADGRFQFDSGQLGTITPAVGRTTWQTPRNLPVGTYTYFCRIHPFMRGSFRVTR